MRLAVARFEQFGVDEGEFGVADVLARAKVTSEALAYNGLVQSWREILRLAGESAQRRTVLAQATLI